MNKSLIALFAALSMMTLAACTDQQQENMENEGEQAAERMENEGERVEEQAEETYNNIMDELDGYKDEGEVCMSSLEDLEEEWEEFTDSIDVDDLDNIDGDRLAEWGNNLQEEMDDMGDIVDDEC